MRALRTLARLSLAEALEIHRHARRASRTTLVAGVPFASASVLAVALEAAGIAASVARSGVATPMVGRPRADEIRACGVAPSSRKRLAP